MRRLTCLFIFTGCFLLFLGCGQKKDNEVKDTEVLKKIALEYWNNRLISRNYENSYAREIDEGKPDFNEYKKLVSRNEVFRFSNLNIIQEQPENDFFLVTVGIKAIGGGLPVAVDREFKDLWRYDSGKWKHRFSKNQP